MLAFTQSRSSHGYAAVFHLWLLRTGNTHELDQLKNVFDSNIHSGRTTATTNLTSRDIIYSKAPQLLLWPEPQWLVALIK